MAGADAALVLNPFYFKGLMTMKALKNHYFEVADASEIPVIIYNMPANSGMDMSAEPEARGEKFPGVGGGRSQDAVIIEAEVIEETSKDE